MIATARARTDLALLALVVASATACAADVQPLAGLLLLLAFCTVPGAAVLTRLDPGEPVVGLALAIGISLAVDTAAATLMAWSGWWEPELAAAAVALAAVTLLCTDLRRCAAAGTGRTS